MTPVAWIALAGVVLSIALQLVNFGRLTEKVSGHEQRLNANDAEQGRQWEMLGRHGERITTVEAKVNSLEQKRHG